MLTPKDIFGNISGGRLLDVATGSGSFIPFLMEGLKDYDEIIGIDTNERAAVAFKTNFKDQQSVHFELMDALSPGFPPGSFDTVCISNSLHHFEEPRAVLAQMLHLLRPGGHIIISEMVKDGQTETQQTHVLLHHWWAAIDSLNGICHHETYNRQGIIDLTDDLGLEDIKLYDLADTSDDPKSQEIVQQLNKVIDMYMQRTGDYTELQNQGETLRTRVSEIGFHSATTLVITGVFSREYSQDSSR